MLSDKGRGGPDEDEDGRCGGSGDGGGHGGGSACRRHLIGMVAMRGTCQQSGCDGRMSTLPDSIATYDDPVYDGWIRLREVQ